MKTKIWKEIYRADLEATGLLAAGLKARLTDRRFKFYKSLRKTEYYTNCRKDFFGRMYAKLLRLKHDMLCDKYQWTIPINVFDEGLSIVHVGTIVVSGDAKVGKNCRIHVCTNIGRAPSKEGAGAPVIGDNVYIGPGAKLFGKIYIGDNTAIGANAVVNSSFAEGNCSIGGIPAKVISQKGSYDYIIRKNQEENK